MQDETLFLDGGYDMSNSHLNYQGSQLYIQAIIDRLAAKLAVKNTETAAFLCGKL